MNCIASVSGTTLTLKTPLKYNYVAGSQTLVVPQFGNVNIAAGATLTAPPWDGLKGGILVFQAKGDVTVLGNISMAGRGFRGAGVVGTCFPGSPGCLINHGRTGESSTGPSAFSTLNGQAQGMNNGSGGGGGSRDGDGRHDGPVSVADGAEFAALGWAALLGRGDGPDRADGRADHAAL